MPCIGVGVKGRAVFPVLSGAIAATQGGSQVQKIFRVGQSHPFPVPCRGPCQKALAGNRGVNVMNEPDGQIQACCIFCKEQIRSEKISSAVPAAFKHVCPHCGEIYLGPEQEEDFYRFFSRKTDLVACNTQKGEIYAPASCLTCRQP